MKVNEDGIKTDCFGYNEKKNQCNILSSWYSEGTRRCAGCPFHKTHEQLHRELAGDFSKSRKGDTDGEI